MTVAPLSQQHCEPCEIGTPPLTLQKEDQLIAKLPGWKLNRSEIHQIQKTFAFKDFQESLDFIHRVGSLAEKEGHHPDILLHNYKNVTITLFTHKIRGLSHNDFILAAKTDRLVVD